MDDQKTTVDPMAPVVGVPGAVPPAPMTPAADPTATPAPTEPVVPGEAPAAPPMGEEPKVEEPGMPGGTPPTPAV